MNKQGFTLVEILTAVVIVAILTVMAMPLYEKTVERSHLAEARTIMNRLQAAKLAAMGNMECDSYDPTATDTTCPKLQHLHVTYTNADGTPARGTTFQTKDFVYSLGAKNDTYPNGICAKRRAGDYKDTVFAYYGLRQDDTTDCKSDETKCEAVFACKGDACEDYGLDNTSGLKCTF